MKKTEQQLADELDLFLTAAMRGGTPSLTPEAQSEEAKLAAELMQLAAENEPEPKFVKELEKRLVKKTAVSPHPKVNAPERSSLWRQIQHFVKEGLTMKRTVYALGALAAVAVVVLAGLFLMNGRPGTEPDAMVADVTATPAADVTDTPADSGSEAVEDATPAAVADLPKLPALEGGSAGFGLGGGGETSSGAPVPEAGSIVADASMPIFTDIFSGTSFVLNTTLPTEPGTALVQRQDDFATDEARAQEIATRFGFDGPLYEQYTRPYPEDMEFAQDYEQPPVYFTFDGLRALIIDNYGVYYRNDGVLIDFENPLPFEQIVPVAEAFVTERGLATFPYMVKPGWGSDVLFYRLIDGQPIDQPEIAVTVTSEGQVAFASYGVLTNLQDLGQYPLISAEAAWALIQDGILDNDILYTWLPPEAGDAVTLEEPVMDDRFQFWQREHQPGEEVHIYTWPNIFLPLAGDGAPRIEAYPYILGGDTAVLDEIVATEDSMLHIWGTLAADGGTLEVIGWETMAEPQSLFLEGVIRFVDGEVQLLTNERDTYILPNAPADLTEGMDVAVFAWSTRDTGAAQPLLDWESIEKRVPPPEGEMPDEGIALPEPMPIDGPGFGGPPTIETVTFDEVSLGYYRLTMFPEVAEGDMVTMEMRYSQPPVVLMPVWQFTGTTNTGERMQFSVAAVAPEYLEAQP